MSGHSDKVFTSDKDVFDIIELLIEEVKEANDTMGKDFDITGSISFQLPIFSCPNIILDKQSQKDISRYVYCEKFNTPPFLGGYNDQPKKWLSKSSVIESAIAKRKEKNAKDRHKKSKDGEI